MRGTCKHGNPLTNPCAFCKREAREGATGPSGRTIPGVGQPLPKLRCSKCGYTTPYRDALRRHTCARGRLTGEEEETARRLIDGLAWKEPRKGLVGWFAGLFGRPEPKAAPEPPPAPAPQPTADEKRLAAAEDYLAELCGRLDIKVPLLIFADELQNEGACGEAGQNTIWLHRESTLTHEWSAVQMWIRHEVAHIVVHNTPGWGEAPAHGVEFDAALAIVERNA